MTLTRRRPAEISLSGVAVCWLAVFSPLFIHFENSLHMTKQVIYSLIFLLSVLFAPISSTASVAVSKDEMRTGVVEKMRTRTENISKPTSKKAEKRMNRLTKRLERFAEKRGMDIDFDDPTDRWLWFGIFGLAIAIVFAILGIGVLSGLCAFAALVCLVIWIVKRGAV